MDNEIMELLKKYEPDSVSAVERASGECLELKDLSLETMERYSISRTAHNLIKAASGRKQDIVSNSPNICRAFADSPVSGMSIYIMDREDMFHTSVLKDLDEMDLERIGIDSLTERKRIMEVIKEDILSEVPEVRGKNTSSVRHPFLWGLLGFINILPFSLALYLFLDDKGNRAATNLGWGIVINIIVSVIFFPILLF